RWGRRGQSDRPRDRAVDLFDLKEREVEPGARLDVADPFHLEDLLVVAADLLQHVDRGGHLAVRSRLHDESVALAAGEFFGDVAVGDQIPWIDEPSGPDPREVGIARQLDTPDGGDGPSQKCGSAIETRFPQWDVGLVFELEHG